MKTKILVTLGLVAPMLVACGDNSSSYSILPTGQSFQQSSSTVNNEIDLLWVVDNSSSMTPLQENMTTNFNSFMSQFVTKGYDFHLAVTTTDAYLAGANFDNNASESVFQDGVSGNETGVFDILSTTPNLVNVFVTNASQGATGSGDERAFSSLQEAMNNSSNAGFLRSTSFFGVIILSDEDDFSDPTREEYSWIYEGGIPDHDYSDPNLLPVSYYENYFDTLTNSSGATRRWNMSAIAVLDDTCLDSHLPDSPTSVVGQRYMQVASDTNGVTASICDASYATDLTAIQQNILQLGTQFYLSQQPVVSTITVSVNGASVPNSSTDGWQYISASNSIEFFGTAVPPAGAAIAVNFQPQSLSF